MEPISSDVRPWGFYEVLMTDTPVQLKRIIVSQNRRLSLQTHEHRAEHWFVVHGKGTVTVGDVSWEVTAGDYVHIPKGEKHRVATDKGTALEFYEMQFGDYLGEDDIVRIEDDYGR